MSSPVPSDYMSFEIAYTERYRKVLAREMTIEDALAEHARDWDAMKAFCAVDVPGHLYGDYMRNMRTGKLTSIGVDGKLVDA